MTDEPLHSFIFALADEEEFKEFIKNLNEQGFKIINKFGKEAFKKKGDTNEET